jgi:hypothetical protein
MVSGGRTDRPLGWALRSYQPRALRGEGRARSISVIRDHADRLPLGAGIVAGWRTNVGDELAHGFHPPRMSRSGPSPAGSELELFIFFPSFRRVFLEPPPLTRSDAHARICACTRSASPRGWSGTSGGSRHTIGAESWTPSRSNCPIRRRFGSTPEAADQPRPAVDRGSSDLGAESRSPSGVLRRRRSRGRRRLRPRSGSSARGRGRRTSCEDGDRARTSRSG